MVFEEMHEALEETKGSGLFVLFGFDKGVVAIRF